MSHVTHHGRERASERLGLPKSAVPKLAAEALERGQRHGDFSGRFKRYLDKTFLQHRTANNMRVYHEHLFIFDGNVLITCWRLPQHFVAAANKAAKRANPKAWERG